MNFHERHVLVVFPHPDDETFGKAGLIAQYTQAGTPVTLVCGTLGQMGRNMGKPFFANRETLPSIRERELRNACKVLGIADLRLLGFRDKTLEFEDPEILVNQVQSLLEEIHPSVLLTYYPQHGVHPDHDALSAAAVTAVARLPITERPVVYASPVTKHARQELGPPSFELDVTPVLNIKLAALQAHKSQTEAMLKEWEAKIANSSVAHEEMMKSLSHEAYWTYPV
ncbi:bacillithiol biosynthesis deacetylase BshB2 [Alicyclobacillaceae bacterium I2511]|nr:bacillithiol biosynthesis deacetylase BshB2 [Alicyclobacillaceae bacterium I2511]